MKKTAEIKSDRIKLNLGCEDQVLPGFINVDIKKKEGVFNYDLNKHPYPWKDNSVDFILASNVIEHLDDPTKFMLELYRICKDGTIVEVIAPHFSLFANNADLTHKRPGLSYLTFGNNNWNKEINKKFKTLNKKLYFTRSNFTFLNYIFNPIINFEPIFYERFLAYMLPCSQIRFILKVVKK